MNIWFKQVTYFKLISVFCTFFPTSPWFSPSTSLGWGCDSFLVVGKATVIRTVLWKWPTVHSFSSGSQGPRQYAPGSTCKTGYSRNGWESQDQGCVQSPMQMHQLLFYAGVTETNPLWLTNPAKTSWVPKCQMQFYGLSYKKNTQPNPNQPKMKKTSRHNKQELKHFLSSVELAQEGTCNTDALVKVLKT